MRPLASELLATLDFKSAIAAEASTDRNLIPSEPAWPQLVAHSNAVDRWIRGQLKAGYNPFREQIIGARKFGHGIRPVALWHPIDRIVYRALVTRILKDQTPVDRSREAYLEFTVAPVRFGLKNLAMPAGKISFNLKPEGAKYIVKSDITAFYQYIDHEILFNELVLQTGEADLAEVLIELLGGTQGRRFGIPQLLDSSDELSEIYIAIAEREMIRKGWNVWRYNDDFRIAAGSYFDALLAVEDLDSAARRIGLVVSEHKTTTPTFVNYFLENTGLSIDSDIPEDIAPEDAVGEYDPLFDFVSESAAIEAIQTANPSRDSRIDLRTTSLDEMRTLRRALGTLRNQKNPAATPALAQLISFVGVLTPDTVKYLVSIAEDSPVPAFEAMDSIISTVALNEWQRFWLADGVRRLGMLSASFYEGRVLSTITMWASSDPSAAVRAAAMRTLAAADKVPSVDISKSLDSAPDALAPFYLSAIKEIPSASPNLGLDVVKAVKGINNFTLWVLS